MIAATASTFVTPADAWRTWSLDPLVMAGLAVLAWLYGRGYTTLRGRRSSRAPLERSVAFAGGIAALVIALVSPLDALAGALFSAHMVQHLLLIVVVPPLLVWGRTLPTVSVGLSMTLRRWLGGMRRRLHPFGRLLRAPAVAWILFTVVMWAWHLPGPYQAAVRITPLHACEHISFLGTSLLVWSIALDERSRTSREGLDRSLFLIAAALQSSVLGAILVFASRPLYPIHGVGPSLWGLTPLQDQQLAGALMWIPPAVIYLATAAFVLVRWFRAMDARAAPRTAGAG